MFTPLGVALIPGIRFNAVALVTGFGLSVFIGVMVGSALVTYFGPCPPIESDDGTGRPLITGTFKHTSATVIDLQILGEPEPIGTTANHPFWSVDRNRYVAAGELRLSERLRTVNDEITRVTGVSPRPGKHDVYNIQIDGQHVFYVGNSGVLVHNSCTPGKGAQVASGKFDYLFGNATGARNAAHNAPRTAQNAAQMRRLGLWDDAAGRARLQSHFDDVVNDPTNITQSFSNKFGNFEVRESLFAGPSGQFAKFETTWEILSDGTRRLTTVIPFGGR